MVMGVCRHVLRDAHAAEDAFQASFLALARKAGTIGRRESVAGWLYTVAYRVALRARAARQAGRPRGDGGCPWPAEPTCRPTTGRSGASCGRSCRKRSTACRPSSGRWWSSATWRGGPTRRPRPSSAPQGDGAVAELSRARDRLRGRLSARGVTLAAAPLAFLLGEHAGGLPRWPRSSCMPPSRRGAAASAAGKIGAAVGPALELLEEAGCRSSRGRLARWGVARPPPCSSWPAAPGRQTGPVRGVRARPLPRGTAPDGRPRAGASPRPPPVAAGAPAASCHPTPRRHAPTPAWAGSRAPPAPNPISSPALSLETGGGRQPARPAAAKRRGRPGRSGPPASRSRAGSLPFLGPPEVDLAAWRPAWSRPPGRRRTPAGVCNPAAAPRRGRLLLGRGLEVLLLAGDSSATLTDASCVTTPP